MAGSSSEGRTSRTRSVGTKISGEEYARLEAGQKLETYTYSWGSGGFASGLAGINIYFGGKLLQSKGVWVATDRLGSVRANSNGESMSYWPYGEERTNTANSREKFGTCTRDAIGQDYAMARYYNASIGTFWSPDPGGIKTADPNNPLSWNRYAYGLADPINMRDPTGKIACDTDGGDEDGCAQDPDDCDDDSCEEGGDESSSGDLHGCTVQSDGSVGGCTASVTVTATVSNSICGDFYCQPGSTVNPDTSDPLPANMQDTSDPGANIALGATLIEGGAAAGRAAIAAGRAAIAWNPIRIAIWRYPRAGGAGIVILKTADA